ncbi:unnamed protein product [Pieris macdunnoughi]|uniref:Uncharacterized protein n=1 Tax=Pieris macdunnoughi TaxID=345717 RepID=A0A821W8K9_9NEOP|nr:unnamed protein product [Pieris macdunnoughi]
MNYVYYENPNLGYVASLSGSSPYTKTRLNGPKKFFVGNTNQKYMKLANEEAINSLFSIGKLSPKMFDPVIDTNNVNAPKLTEDDTRQTKQPEIINKDLKFVEIDQTKKSRDSDVNHQNSKFRMAPDSNIKEVQKPHHEDKPMNQKKFFRIQIKAK